MRPVTTWSCARQMSYRKLHTRQLLYEHRSAHAHVQSHVTLKQDAPWARTAVVEHVKLTHPYGESDVLGAKRPAILRYNQQKGSCCADEIASCRGAKLAHRQSLYLSNCPGRVVPTSCVKTLACVALFEQGQSAGSHSQLMSAILCLKCLIDAVGRPDGDISNLDH